MHVGAIGVNAPRHASQPEKMQRKEGDVEADEEEPEVPLSQCCVGHPSSDFREPEIDSCEHGKKSAADQYIMKVRNDKVGVVDLQIDGDGRQHDSRQSPNQEHEKEAEAPEHRQ